VEVVARGPVEDTARRAFEVATPEALARLSAAYAEIARRAEPPLSTLAQAVFALRDGWPGEARGLAAAYAAARPDDAYGKALLELVR
jgi:hypothetical protein